MASPCPRLPVAWSCDCVDLYLKSTLNSRDMESRDLRWVWRDMRTAPPCPRWLCPLPPSLDSQPSASPPSESFLGQLCPIGPCLLLGIAPGAGTLEEGKEKGF